jgi:hypothetical protein
MISGDDIVIKSSAKSEVVFRLAFLATKNLWKDAVVENSDTGVLLSPDVFVGLDEIMIYKDEKSRKSWAKDGAAPPNHNTMIHIMKYGDDEVTVVVDDRTNPEMVDIVGSLCAALDNNK